MPTYPDVLIVMLWQLPPADCTWALVPVVVPVGPQSWYVLKEPTQPWLLERSSSVVVVVAAVRAARRRMMRFGRCMLGVWGGFVMVGGVF